MGTLAKIFLPSLDWRTKALCGNFGKDFPAILGLTNKSSTWELWQRFSCHPWTDEQKLYVGTLAKIFLPSLDWRTKALHGNFGKDFPAILGLTNKSSTETFAKKNSILGTIGKDFPAILGLSNKSSMWEHWQRFSCHPWTDEQKLYVGTLAKIFLPSLDWRTKALHVGTLAKIFLPSLGLTNKSSMWELWQRFSCHPWTDEWQRFSCHPWTVEQKLYVGTLAKIFLPSLDWWTKALRGNFCKDFLSILGLTNEKLYVENIGKDFPAILGLIKWQRFSCHPWTDEQKLYIGKDFPAILGLTNKSTWEHWQRFSCHPWTDEQKLYVGTLAKIFLPSLDWRTKALRGNFGKDFPAILGLTNKSSTWELWQRFSCHPWTDEQKLYVENFGKDFPAILGLTNKELPAILGLSKIFLPSLDCRMAKALCKNIGKDFPAILGLIEWQRFSCHPWTVEQKALCGNIGKDFPAILRLTNESSTWELWHRFSCHPWTVEQKLYVGTLAKIFLPSLDWRTKALRGNFGKDFPAILGLTNKSSTWELWQRFSCHPWTDEQKLYVGTLAKIFLPSLDWRTKALHGNFGKDFPAILGLTKKDFPAILGLWNKSSTWEQKDFPAILGLTNGKDFPAILGLSNKSSWELWQRFSCHPWTDEQKLYVETLAKIFLPSLDCRMAKIFLPSLDWRTKALRGNFGKDFPAILGLTNKSSMWELWQRFSCHPWTDEQKLYVGTLAKIFLPSLDWWTKALCGNFGKDFPAILGLTNKSSTCGTLAKIFLPSLDWRTKALCGNFGKDFPAILGLTNGKAFPAIVGLNFGKDFPAILGLTNKSSMWELWQRFSCHPWTDEQKLYVELWQRFSCHPWTDEQKLYVGTLAKIFLPSLDWRTKALCGNFGKDFPAILGLTNKSSTWELWQRFSCHPWKLSNKSFSCHPWNCRIGKIFLPSLDCRTKALCGNIGKDFPAILGEQKLYLGTLAKIFLPSLDWRTKALCGNIGKDFPAILGLTNKSSMWELWQRFSCHPWTDEQKLYMGTLAKIFLPSLDWQTKTLRGNIGKDFNAILGLSNGTDFPAILGLNEWQRFSCHPWTDKQKLYVRTLAKIFLPSLDWWMAKIFLPSLDWRTKALHGNIGKALLWELWQRFSCHPWTDEQKCGNFGKDFPAILGLTNKSSMWELWQRLGLTNKSSTSELWQRFSCQPWSDEQKALCGNIGTCQDCRMAKIFLLHGNIGKDFPDFQTKALPSLDWRTKALRGNFGKDFPAILGLTNKRTDEQKLYFGKDFPVILGTLAKIFLPSLDWRTKALRGNFSKDFPAILRLSNKCSTWKHWQRFSCHP